MRQPLPTKTLYFPRGGIVRSLALQRQEQQGAFTTPAARNVVSASWPSGRRRGGTRPTLTASVFDVAGDPYAWCDAVWKNGSVQYRGIAVTHAGGTSTIHRSGTSLVENEVIATAPSSNFSSCAIYLQRLYQTSAGHQNPLCYNLAAGSSSSTTGWDGYGPTYCGLVAAQGDRLWFAGDKNNFSAVYACRMGGREPEGDGELNDSTAWDYTALDAGRAWRNVGNEPGKLSEPLSSLIPHSQDCMLFGCTDGLFVVRGNPAATGSKLATLSTKWGPLTPQAWVHDGQGRVWMHTRGGLCVMADGCGGPLEPVSHAQLPRDLKAVDPEAGDRICVGWDSRFNLIHIYVDRASGTDEHWVYDLDDRGFWEWDFGSTRFHLAPDFKSLYDDEKSAVIPIASTGDAYRLDASDSSESMTASVLYGPVALGDRNSEGILHSISAIVGEGSGTVEFNIYAGDSPEQALAKYDANAPDFTDDWDIDGLNYRSHPRVRGVCFLCEVKSDGAVRWAMEDIVVEIEPCGPRRVG